MNFLVNQLSNLFQQGPENMKDSNSSGSFGSTSGQETVIELKRGTLSYIRPTDSSGKVQESTIYKSSSLAIKKGSSPFNYHLVVSRILGN